MLFDSRVDAAKLDNHADREEIRTAREEGKGLSIRYSKTLSRKTVNYAVRLSDGSILRVSTEQYTVIAVLLGMLQPVFIIVFAALLLTLVLSSRISKAVIEPLNRLDLDVPENNDVYEELTPLLRKIVDQKKTIEEQLADARKKQKEFHLITENMSEGFLVIDQDANLLTCNSAALSLLEIVIGAVLVILDITEREKRESLRREFTANVSHELKTPLTSISGFAELMKAGNVAEKDVIDFSESIYVEAQRLITLVGDIIKLSELDGQNISFENEPVDLYELSGEIIGRLHQEARKKNVKLHRIGGKAEVMGVRRILDEMLYNLCDNAVKYNQENGIVDVLINQDAGEVNVIVRDTGIGIPAAHQDRVFERFYRVDKSHSKKIGGTGLGLAIVKHGAICHHAKISLQSAVGEGTSITLIFSKM